MSPASPSFNAVAAAIPQEAIDAFTALAANGSKIKISAAIDKHGAAILDAADSQGRTAIIAAAETGHGHIMGLLLDRGASIDARDRDGNTALMTAAGHGYGHTACVLIERGADVNAVNTEGRSALFFAVTHRDTSGRSFRSFSGKMMPGKKKALVSLLLSRGANPSIRDAKGATAESWARQQGYAGVADQILKEAEAHARQRAVDVAVFTEGLPEDIVVLRARYKIGRPAGPG